MSGPRIGALCAGYGGLDLAVKAVLGGELAWVADKDPASAKVLAHRFPDAPNLGDITAIDWGAVERVDILTAGFPCQDLSLAGRRAGLRAGTRSGIWKNVRDAIAVLRPSLVIVENVRGLLSAPADGDVERCPWCLGDGSGEPPLRGIGVVLGDLAELGFDAEWVGLRAADVGACHGRFRVGILAWPAADAERGERERELHPRRGALGGAAAAGRGAGPAAHPDRDAVRLEPVALTGSGGPALAGLAGVERGPGPAEDADRPAGSERRESAPGQAPGRRARADAGGSDRARAAADPDSGGLRADERQLREREPDAAGRAAGDAQTWGPYEPAIRRWELILGRPAPAPTEPSRSGGQRLAPAFVEWMQGLPAGWVTEVPGLSRNDQLRLLGNGVVPQQFTEAIRHLLARAECPDLLAALEAS